MASSITTYLDIGTSAVKIMEVKESSPPLVHSFYSFDLESIKSVKPEARLANLKEQLIRYFSDASGLGKGIRKKIL